MIPLILITASISTSLALVIRNSSTEFTSFDKRAPAPYFEVLVTGSVASISSILAPNTGKVIQIERITGGRYGTTHSQEVDVQSARTRPLVLPADSWCSGGFISPEASGRVVNIAGFSGDALDNNIDFTSCGTPGTFGTCDWRNLAGISASSLLRYRWYPTSLPLPSGRVAVISGSTTATGTIPPPTFEANMEFIPRLPNEQVIPIQLLKDTETDSLYPHAHVLSNGNVFLISGHSSKLYNSNTFQPIPNVNIPDIAGKRTYPLSGGSVLLQLNPANNYVSEIMVCGGSSYYTVNAPALNTCGRITPLSITPTWEMSTMNYARVLPDMVILPNGNIFIANGASQGWSGFDAQRNPVYQSEIYNPFTKTFTNSATSNIARLYHSEALLLEDGRIMISGSTPYDYANTANTPFPDETRIEVYYPDYLISGLARPTITTISTKAWNYWQTITVTANIPSGDTSKVTASLFTNGFVTHSLHMGQRSVRLNINIINGNTFQLIAPPNANIVPPGWYMLFLMDGATPAIAQWVQVGGDPAGMVNWPAQTTKPPTADMCAAALADRVDCGYGGIDEARCNARGCCWGPNTGGPWCFNAVAPKLTGTCAVAVADRKDCGVPGITETQCTAKGCCWGPNTVGGPWCFNGVSSPVTGTCAVAVADRKDCGVPGITETQCNTKGCCWGPNTVGGPWCFNGVSSPVTGTCAVAVADRKDCGVPGITETQCNTKGCCWGPNTVGGPWCYNSVTTPTVSKCTNLDPLTRINCGFSGITPAQCIDNGCCYGELQTPGINCYISSQPTCANLNALARVDCGVPGITADQCRAKGCCFGESNGPWCFKPATCNPTYPVKNRVECGFPGINAAQCLSKGCCYDESQPGPWCFM